MPYYADSNALYAVLRTTFTRLIKESPDHLDGLKSLVEAKMVLQLRTTNPTAEITLNARDKGFQAIYGPTTVKADLIVDLTGDDLHLILLDQLSIKKAWNAKQIKVKGPVWKLQVLTDMVKGARDYYPRVVQEQQAPAVEPAAPAATAKKTSKRGA
ncbi:MAG: SCP2 sterol-binding domain-containing protein [Anaerolineae bacterium]